jgi:hypothetical protein
MYGSISYLVFYNIILLPTRFLAPNCTEHVFVNLLRGPGIEPVRQPYLSNQTAWIHRLAESIPLNLFLGSLNVYKYELSTVILCRQSSSTQIGSDDVN